MRCWPLPLLVTCACATPAAKMAWPVAAAAPTPAPAHGHGGQGGSVDDPPDALPVVVVAPPAPTRQSLVFKWPIPRAAINSLFGYRTDPVDGSRRFHSGVDLDGAYGQVVATAAPGRVVRAGWSHGHGRQIVVEHAGGFVSSYSHLAQVLVEEGAWLSEDHPIGMLGNSGRSTGPHLHFEIARNGQLLDPLDLLGALFEVD